MKPLRVALLGCGRIADLAHLPVLLALPDVDVVALADRDAERRRTAARLAHGVPAFEDFMDAIERSSADAAVICLPPALHAPAAIAAFSAGLHVYLEKPLALETAEAAAVLAAWRESGRTGVIGFNFRFHPLVERLRRALSAGTIGEVVAARSMFTSSARSHPAWKASRATGGGALLNLGSHHLDLVPYLLGEAVAEVSAAVRSGAAEQDSAAVRLQLESGTIVQSLFSNGAAASDRWELIGRDGRITMDRYGGSLIVEGATRVTARAARLGQAMRTAGREITRALRRDE
ncbi:MAG: Gfo/Idh/MocA family protein, partial [Longimicrobiales bacterium]